MSILDNIDFPTGEWIDAGWDEDLEEAAKWWLKGFTPQEAVFLHFVLGFNVDEVEKKDIQNIIKKYLQEKKELIKQVMVKHGNTEEQVEKLFKWCEKWGFYDPYWLLDRLDGSVVDAIGYPKEIERNTETPALVEYGYIEKLGEKYPAIKFSSINSVAILNITQKSGGSYNDNWGGATGLGWGAIEVGSPYHTITAREYEPVEDFHKEGAFYWYYYTVDEVDKLMKQFEEERKRKAKEEEEKKKKENEKKDEIKEFEEKYFNGKDLMDLYDQLTEEEQKKVCKLADPYNSLFYSPTKEDIYWFLKNADKKIKDYEKEGWQDFADDYRKLIKRFRELANDKKFIEGKYAMYDVEQDCEKNIQEHLREIVRRAKGLQNTWVEMQADYVWEEWLEDFRRNNEKWCWIPTDDVPYDEFLEELYDGLNIDCNFMDFVDSLIYFDEITDLVAQAYGKVADIVKERIERYLNENGYKWYIRNGEYIIEEE